MSVVAANPHAVYHRRFSFWYFTQRYGFARSPISDGGFIIFSLKKDMGGILPRIPSFQQLVILYEKSGRYQEALDICNLALRNNLKDTTKGGYEGRIEKIQKKMENISKA